MTTQNRSDYYKEWRKRNPEKTRESARRSEQKWRDNNPETAKEVGIKYRKSRRELVDKLKNKPCLDCGNTFPPECMDFDHVRGAKKLGIYQMYTSKMELLLEEIAKCDLVCANCHRVRTCKRKPPTWKKVELET